MGDSVAGVVSVRCFKPALREVYSEVCFAVAVGGGSYTSFEDGRVLVVVDVTDADAVWTLVHELLHVVGLSEEQVNAVVGMYRGLVGK